MFPQESLQGLSVPTWRLKVLNTTLPLYSSSDSTYFLAVVHLSSCYASLFLPILAAHVEDLHPGKKHPLPGVGRTATSGPAVPRISLSVAKTGLGWFRSLAVRDSSAKYIELEESQCLKLPTT